MRKNKVSAQSESLDVKFKIIIMDVRGVESYEEVTARILVPRGDGVLEVYRTSGNGVELTAVFAPGRWVRASRVS